MRNGKRDFAWLFAAPLFVVACVGADPDVGRDPASPVSGAPAASNGDTSAPSGSGSETNTPKTPPKPRDPEVKTLATQANLVSIAAGNADSIYVRQWDDTAMNGTILRVSKATGAAAAITSFAGWKLFGTGLAVVGDDVYFGATDESGNTRVFVQPSGTPATTHPRSVVETSCGAFAAEPACHGLSTDGAAFVWRQADKLFACKLPCTAPIPIVDGSLLGAAVAPTHVVYGTSAAGVTRCERDGCTSATPLASATAGATKPELFAVHDGVVYWADNQIGADKARILACAIEGCGGNPKVLVKGEFEISGLTVNDAGIYFTHAGRPFGEPDGVLKVCRDRGVGCGVGSEVLADKLAQPTDVVSDAQWIYFLTRGVTPDVGPVQGAGVHRTAR